MNEKIFAEGISFKEPSGNAPAWIKGQLSFNVEKFKTFLDDYKNERGWVNIDMKESKNQSVYFELNTWKASKDGNGNWKPKPEEATVQVGDESVVTDIADGEEPF